MVDHQRGRILFASRAITRGGTSRVTLDLIRFLETHGFECAFALTTPNSRVPDDVPCTVIPLRVPRLLHSVVRQSPRLADLLFNRWFWNVVRRYDPTVVYCITLSERLMRASLGLGRPCVEHVHALHLDSFTRGTDYLHLLSSFADHYVCSSRRVAERLKYSVGVPKEKVEVLYHGVDVASLHARAAAGVDAWRQRLGVEPGDVMVGGVGVLDYVKGVDRFVSVVREVARAVPKAPRVRYVWAGSRHHQDDQYGLGVQALIKDSGLSGVVEFVDYLDDVAPFLALLDVVVIPSRAESLPLLLLEALALGRPVAAFPIGGIPEVLEHGGGLMTPGEDPAELAQLVIRLVRDPQLRGTLGEAASRNIRANFVSSARFEAYLDMLERVVGRSGAPNGMAQVARVREGA